MKNAVGFVDKSEIPIVSGLKDLTGRDKFENLMLKKRRKSLALCQECFDESHACSS